MKKNLTAALAVLLTLVIIFGALASSGFTAASGALSYSFSGAHAGEKGWAQGTLTLSADASSGGTYYLYWADDTAALSGYDPICTLTVSNSSSKSYTMPAYTAIPARATRVVGFKGSVPSSPAVSAAAVQYIIPASKALGKTQDDLLYSFASYSDTHIASNEEGSSDKYPYDEQHLAAAFSVAADRGVDFIVTTGDHVNNQRADSKGGGNPFYPEEWNTYLKILAASDYVNPIYEAIGNHELWCYDTTSNYSSRDWKTGSDYFLTVTGMDSTAATLNSGKAYYEVTEPVTGDHFLFMALEGGFYTDSVDEFSDDQLSWLDKKLSAYQNDGKNVFILEHANFDSWGSGDQLSNPIYDIPLKDKNPSTGKLKALLKKYKNAVFLSGHTHFKFDLQLNYSDNSGTSATMIHNSAVGAVRNILSGTTRQDDKSLELSEGYIVEVYEDATIFYGTNLYRNKILPYATYMVAQTTSSLTPKPTEPPTEAPTEPPTEAPTEPPTEAPTDPPTEAPTEPPTEAPTDPPTEAPTEPPTEAPTDPPTEAPTEAPTEPPTEAPTEPPTEEPTVPVLMGDVDDDGDVTIVDASYIQRYEIGVPTPTPVNETAADVNRDDEINIVDATVIRRFLIGLIENFDIFAEPEPTVVYEEPRTPRIVGNADLAPVGADLNTLRSQAKTALDKYWLLASYDQYQALKKAYKQNADADTLSAALTAFNAAVSSFYTGDSVDIYFSNNLGWSNVYAYCSAGHGKDKNATWPGQKMDYVSTNTYGEKIYKITVPSAKYNFIIFTNNSGAQTIDLPLGVTKNQGFYYDANLGKDSRGYYRCSSYVYK